MAIEPENICSDIPLVHGCIVRFIKVLVDGSFRIYIHPVSMVGQTIPVIFTIPISGFWKIIVDPEKFAAQNGSVPFDINQFIVIGDGGGVTGVGAGACAIGQVLAIVQVCSIIWCFGFLGLSNSFI